MEKVTRTILHVDMDAFFAAIEQRDHPEWRGLPVIVGAPPDARGVVSTCSYEARRFGVHSAMPSRTAGKLCPQGIFVPPDGRRYAAVSREVHEVFSHYTPLVEPVSVDEAFLDVTGSLHLYGDARTLAQRLKAEIRAVTQLTASVGVAHNKFLAKIASDLEKPDGLTLVPREPEAVAAFLAPLKVGRIWGIGKKSEEVLRQAGILTVGDLQRAPEAKLRRLLGEAGSSHAHALAFGLDTRTVELDSVEKSVSNEHTYDEDCRDWLQVEGTLLELVQQVGQRLRASHKVATTAHLKLRWEDFTTITRQRRLAPATHHDEALLTAASGLLAAARTPRPVRLIGFGVSGLLEETTPIQPELFGEADAERNQRHEQLEHTLDEIRQRYGRKSIRRAGP